MKKSLTKLKSPAYINLMLTTDCNQYCSFCYLNCKSNGYYSPTNNLKKIIDKCAEADVFEINLFGGEPTLHPNFIEIAKYCKDYGFNVGFSTNGILIDQKFANEIEKYIDGVTVSIHGFKDTHEKLTNEKGSYKKAINAVKNLIDSNIPTSINFTLTKINKNELEDFGRYVLDNYDIGSFEAGRLIQTGRGKTYRNILDLNIKDYNNCLDILSKLSNEYNKKILFSDSFPLCLIEEEKNRELVRGCSAGIDFCAIDKDGNIKICNAFDFDIGNILESSLEEIWQNNQKLEEYRNLEWVSEPCNKCSSFETCLSGCKVTSDSMKDILLVENQDKIKPTNYTKTPNTSKAKLVNINSKSKPCILPNVKIRKDLEGYTIYCPGSPLYFTNYIGYEVLQKCNGKTKIEDISKYLSEKYGINHDFVRKDINHFLTSVNNFLYYES